MVSSRIPLILKKIGFSFLDYSESEYILKEDAEKYIVTGNFDEKLIGDDYLELFYNKNRLILNTNDGTWKFLTNDSEEMINSPNSVFWRPLTDNDFISAKMWREYGVDRITTNLVSSTVLIDNSELVKIRVVENHGAAGKYWYIQEIKDITFYANGLIHYDIIGVPHHNYPSFLPRIGLEWSISKLFTQTKWLGLGPFENYLDTNTGAYKDVFTSKINDLNFQYLYPQESGNRRLIEWVDIYTNNRNGIRFGARDKEFNFSIHQSSIKKIDEAQHIHEVINDNNLWFYLDYEQQGIGSRSCGPDVLPKYRCILKDYNYQFDINLNL